MHITYLRYFLCVILIKMAFNQCFSSIRDEQNAHKKMTKISLMIIIFSSLLVLKFMKSILNLRRINA